MMIFGGCVLWCYLLCLSTVFISEKAGWMTDTPLCSFVVLINNHDVESTPLPTTAPTKTYYNLPGVWIYCRIVALVIARCS